MKNYSQHFNYNLSLITGFLRKPYGLYESRINRLIISACISCFVWFFLFSFGLFDFDYFPAPRRFYITGVYSLFCFLSLLFNSFLIQDLVIKRSTLASTIAWTIWIMFCIAVCNFLITASIFKFEDFSFYTFIKNQIFTLILGLIIMPLGILLHYNIILKKKLSDLEVTFRSIVHPDGKCNDEVIFHSVYKSDSLKVFPDRILYIKSADNYIDVYYYEKNRICHRLIRNTLASVQHKPVHHDLKKCHRSYIVNIRNIKTIRRNSRGYWIIMDGVESEIPLSGKYRSGFLSRQN